MPSLRPESTAGSRSNEGPTLRSPGIRTLLTADAFVRPAPWNETGWPSGSNERWRSNARACFGEAGAMFRRADVKTQLEMTELVLDLLPSLAEDCGAIQRVRSSQRDLDQRLDRLDRTLLGYARILVRRMSASEEALRTEEEAPLMPPPQPRMGPRELRQATEEVTRRPPERDRPPRSGRPAVMTPVEHYETPGSTPTQARSNERRGPRRGPIQETSESPTSPRWNITHTTPDPPPGTSGPRRSPAQEAPGSVTSTHWNTPTRPVAPPEAFGARPDTGSLPQAGPRQEEASLGDEQHLAQLLGAMEDIPLGREVTAEEVSLLIGLSSTPGEGSWNKTATPGGQEGAGPPAPAP